MLGSGLGMVMRNKRYIFWFWLLNLGLAKLGVTAFYENASGVLDHSLYADRLVHGFSLSAYIEMLARPEFGPMEASRAPGVYLGLVFLVATVLFIPGVFQGYGSTYRLPRDEFFRACGRNLWRFIRLLIVAGIVMGIVAALLFWAHSALVKKAGDSTNELLSVEVMVSTLAIIFLVMTVLRIWLDLAEADVVLNDQRAVRRSMGAAFRHTVRGLGRLLGSYVFAAIVGIVILCAGLAVWVHYVPPASVVGAWAVSQATLLLLLIPRFWQRGVAVSYWKQEMMTAVVEPPPIAPPAPVASEPPPAPVMPSGPTGA